MSLSPEEYHQLLAHQNSEKIESAAVKAFEQRLEVPVVMVLDTADPAALAIANRSGRESMIEAAIATGKERDIEIVMTWPLPARVAMAELRPHHPQAAEPLAPPPAPNAFYVVIVSRGAVSILIAQLP